ncbi:MAG TPA: DNA methyltransferase [Candidatus Saccharimonadia bacterium]|nr:DNA methyltransferase [Candidatus Saccharimonadia bacterium]
MNKSTELVVIGNATLYKGDCVPMLSELKADVLVTDPPYGIAFSHGGKDKSGIGGGKYATTFAKVKIAGDSEPFDPSRLLALQMPTILWGGNHFASRLPDSPSWLVWDKRAASGHTNDFADCEIAWTNLGGVARVFRHHWDGMMRASERGQRFHPTQKPAALMAWCLSFVPAGTVLDPFMGSGTTGVACAGENRPFVGIEINPGYFDVACERIDQAQRQQRLFA